MGSSESEAEQEIIALLRQHPALMKLIRACVAEGKSGIRHIKSIAEQDVADLIYESIELKCEDDTGIITGIGADVGQFILIQGGFSTSIVLVSELPMPVMPSDPTPEEIEEFEQFRRSMIAEFGGSSPPAA